MLSRCPSCGSQVADEDEQCPSCHWDFVTQKTGAPSIAPRSSKPEPPSRDTSPPVLEQLPLATDAGLIAPAKMPTIEPPPIPILQPAAPEPEPKPEPKPEPAPPVAKKDAPEPAPELKAEPEPKPTEPPAPARDKDQFIRDMLAEKKKRAAAAPPPLTMAAPEAPATSSPVKRATPVGRAGIIGVVIAGTLILGGGAYWVARPDRTKSSQASGASPFPQEQAAPAPAPAAAPPAPAAAPAPVPAPAPPRSTASFAPTVKPAPAAPVVVAPPPPPPPAPPEKPAKPAAQWVFEGRVYDIINLQPVFGADIEFRSSGAPMASGSTDHEGRYRVSVDALSGSAGYAVTVSHQDYSSRYIDEIDPPMREVPEEQRRALAKTPMANKPWTGRTAGPTRRDFVMIPKVSAE